MKIARPIFGLMLLILFIIAAAKGASIPLKEVSAEEVIGKINRSEPVEYDHVIIKGDLSIEKANLQKKKVELISLGPYPGVIPLYAPVVNSSIRINDSYIDGPTDFESSIFKGEVNFEKTEFNNYSRFQASQFNGTANFAGSKFNGNAQFGYSQFNSPLYFYNTIFNEDVEFEGAKFNDVVSFWGSRFNKDADFTYSHFFGDYIDFGNSTFCGYVDLSDSKFKGDTYFTGAHFDKSIDLRYSDLVQLDPNLLHLDWCSFQGHLIYDEILFISFINKFKDRGQFEDARNCYYDYRNERRILELNSGIKLMDYLAWLSCGYGVHPSYTFTWGGFFIIFFGIIYWRGKCFRISSYPFMQFSSKFRIVKEILQNIYFSLLIFFHINQSINLYPSKYWKYVVTFENILGWFLLALFMVVLVNVMITWK